MEVRHGWNRTRCNAIIFWVLPWSVTIFIAFMYLIFRKTEPEQVDEIKPNRPTKTPKPTLDPSTQFDWVEAEWVQAPAYPMDRQLFKVEFHGSFLDEARDKYNADHPKFIPRYSIIPACYFCWSNHLVSNNLAYPQYHSLYEDYEDSEPNLFEVKKMENVIAFPVYSGLRSAGAHFLHFLPIVAAIPPSYYNTHTFVLSDNIYGLDGILKELGAKNVVSLDGFTNVFSRDMVVLDPPPLNADMYPYFANIVKRLTQHLDKHSFGNCAIIPPDHSARYQQYNDFVDRLKEKVESTFQNEDMLRKEKIPNSPLGEMQYFYKCKMLITFANNHLTFLPFMKPGNTAIIITDQADYLEYVRFAENVGIKVHLFPTVDFQLTDDLINNIVSIMEDVFEKDDTVA